MTIQPIGPDRLCLLLTAADLSDRGLAPETLGPAQALSLLRAACARSGVALPGPAEVEVYPAPAGALVFVRFRPPRRRPRHFSRLRPLDL